jgi:prepilin-type N-terminal cleavage/methylation domain-containing protein
MKERYFKKAGFTLIEAIVTIVVLSIVAFSVMHLLAEGFRVWVENRDLLELRAEGRIALDRLMVEFREAEIVNLQDAQTLAFEADIFDDGDSRRLVYALNNGRLMRRVIGEPPIRVLCENVSALIFTWNAPLLTVDMTLSRQDDTVNLNTDIMARCLP